MSRSSAEPRPYFSVEVEVKLRPTVSRPVRLGVRHPAGTRDQFFFHIEIFFRQLWVYFVAPSLTRGRVCYKLLVQDLASAVPLDPRPHFIVQILDTPPTRRARSLKEQGCPDILPDTGFLFGRFLRLAGHNIGYIN
jgi:hypothetical protein